MLATAGVLPPDDDAWAFEFKWDGIRVLLWVDGGRPRAMSRGGQDITATFPELREVAAAVGSRGLSPSIRARSSSTRPIIF